MGKDFRKEIKEIRGKLGWSQERLAYYCNVTLKTVQRWETETGPIKPHTKIRIKLPELKRLIKGQDIYDLSRPRLDILTDEPKVKIWNVLYTRPLKEQLGLEEALKAGDVVLVMLGCIEDEKDIEGITDTVLRNIQNGVLYIYPFFNKNQEAELERMIKRICRKKADTTSHSRIVLYDCCLIPEEFTELISNRIIYLPKGGKYSGFLHLPCSVACFLELEDQRVEATLEALNKNRLLRLIEETRTKSLGKTKKT